MDDRLCKYKICFIYHNSTTFVKIDRLSDPKNTADEYVRSSLK